MFTKVYMLYLLFLTELFAIILMYNFIMIELLSDSSWIKPQIDLLLWLQNIRSFCPDIVNKFFLSATVIGEIWVPTVICGILYWCVNAKNGTYMFLLFGFHYIFSQLLKMIACVYRPWILDERVQPLKEAITYSKGYSFPSGHSSMAASNLGGLAFIFRKNIPLCIFLFLVILLVGFSRMWVGVHTLQDVVGGFLIGFVIIFVGNAIINWAEQNKNRYIYLLVIINVLMIAILVYMIYFCKFPMDYVNGELLVNPKGAIHASVVCYGYSMGLMNGAFLCRRFFPFEPENYSVRSRFIIGTIGGILTYLILNFALEYCFASDFSHRYTLLITMLIGLFITAIYPLIFSNIKFLKIY